MKWIGYYSGTIYDTKAEADIAGECCGQIIDDILTDKKLLDQFRSLSKMACIGCNGCPKSNHDTVKGEPK